MPRKKTEIGSYLEGFTRFWAIWPNRVAKKDAEKAWHQLAPSAELERLILGAVARQTADRADCATRGQWVPEWPFPATWIRGERWNDESLQSPAPSGPDGFGGFREFIRG